MTPFRRVRLVRLFSADAKSIGRDPTLLSAIIMSALPPVLFWRWAESWDRAALEAFGLEQLSRYLVPIFLVLPAMLLGWVTGFLLLEDRDDGTLLAVDVTPLGKGGFFLYRACATALIAGLITLASCPVLLPGQALSLTLTLTVLVAMQAVCAAFVLPALARNKVEGLAITKLTNLLSVAPLLALIDSPLRYLGAWLPTFWLGEMLQLSVVYTLPLAVSAGFALLTHIAAGFVLYRLVLRRVG